MLKHWRFFVSTRARWGEIVFHFENRRGRADDSLFPGVDLRPLQLVGVIDVDGFPGGVEVERAGAAFAMAVAGLLDAAEGQMDFGADGGRVDVGDAGFQVAHGAEGAVDVARVERGGEAVMDAVGDFDGLVEVVDTR